MTAFNVSQVPASVNTVEKLHYWSALILQDVNFDTTILEQTNGNAVPVSSAQIFQIRSTDFTGLRAINRVTLPVSVTYASLDNPWDGVQELSTSAIPAGYTT